MASHFRPPFTPTYTGASEFLGQKDTKRISANTVLRRVQYPLGGIALSLHGTDIVTWYQNGQVFIADGGWPTNTTRRYINGCISKRVAKRDGVQYVGGVEWDGSALRVDQ